MTNKVTLITPPDIYENSNFSILLGGLTDQEQDLASAWLGNADTQIHSNIYFYGNEANVPWLLYAANRSDAVYLNLDTRSDIIDLLGGYLISKPHVYYYTASEQTKAIASHISSNFVPSIEVFLEKVYSRD